MTNNENSIHSLKIDSHNLYNSQESKLSRHSRNSSKDRDKDLYKSPFDSNNILNKNQRIKNTYTHNYSQSQDLSKIRSDKINLENSFSEIENRIQRAPKNFVPPNNIPKQSIRTVKGNLYEALNNINKELNVKIEKREIPKIRVSLIDYLHNNQEEAPEIRKNSKKVDIDNVMDNLSNIVKDNPGSDLNSTPNNYSNNLKEINDYDMNIEGILNNSNLNKSSSFNSSTIDKFGGNLDLININSNNVNNNLIHMSENNNEITSLSFTGIRSANEIDKYKLMNQMHSNYSSIQANDRQNNIPYHKKKKLLKNNNNSFNDDGDKNSFNKNLNVNGYNSKNTVNSAYNDMNLNNLLADDEKLNIGLENKPNKNESNKQYQSVNTKNNESIYKKNKASPNTIIKTNHDNINNAESDFESIPQMNLNSNYNTHNYENLIQFNSNNLIDSKEKEIFEHLTQNHILVKKSIRKNKMNSLENFYQLDFTQFIKYMKNREHEFSNKEYELGNLKNEISFLKKDVEGKNNLMRSIEIRQDSTDSELKLRIKELEEKLNNVNMINSRLEKENVILKNELINNKKSKNLILKRFNEEMIDVSKLTKEFFDNFISIEY